jgi:formyltetrahydrofolate deformylase
MERTYTLVISCPDRVGVVAKVSQFLARHGGWITEANHHSDTRENWFFMRHQIRAEGFGLTLEAFRQAFQVIADELELSWFIRDSQQPKRVVLMVSKQSHCLVDLLHRWQSGELHLDIPCVISNHQDMQALVEWHGIPFHHIPVSKDSKESAFTKIETLIDQSQADTIVLARYMQIIPPALCHKYSGQMINIHHSFLPSFVGAMPYHQAFDRGVKLIGATSHYVTEALDQGPIIEQDVVRVSHQYDAEDLVRLGRDVEKNVLARALRWHLEDRVLVHGNKTVVFS